MLAKGLGGKVVEECQCRQHIGVDSILVQVAFCTLSYFSFKWGFFGNLQPNLDALQQQTMIKEKFLELSYQLLFPFHYFLFSISYSHLRSSLLLLGILDYVCDTQIPCGHRNFYLLVRKQVIAFNCRDKVSNGQGRCFA